MNVDPEQPFEYVRNGKVWRLIYLLCLSTILPLLSSAEERPSASELLREVETKKSLVLRDIAHLDQNINVESQRVLRALDSVFAHQVNDLLERHHQDCRNRLYSKQLLRG